MHRIHTEKTDLLLMIPIEELKPISITGDAKDLELLMIPIEELKLRNLQCLSIFASLLMIPIEELKPVSDGQYLTLTSSFDDTY